MGERMTKNECGCDPLQYCRDCELNGRPTPPYQRPVQGIAQPTPIVTPEPPPCIHRGEPVNGQRVAALGYNPSRVHYQCEHPTLALGIVRNCATCGDTVRAPYCGPGCSGYTPEAPEPEPVAPPVPSNVYRPVPKPEIVRTSDRCVLTIAIGPDGESLHALSGPSQRAYAKKIGADYQVIRGRTQAENMVCFEKFRIGDYARAYPEGTVYLDADVFVMPDAPDILDAVPPSEMGLVDVSSRMPGLLAFGLGQLEKISRTVGRPIPTGADEVYWNSGVWVGRPEQAHYWTPPTISIPNPHWCDEESWCRWNAFDLGIPVHDLDRRFNWTWCEDRGMTQWEKSRPWFAHFAGMGEQPDMPSDWKMSNPTVRKLMLKVMEAMRTRTEGHR